MARIEPAGFDLWLRLSLSDRQAPRRRDDYKKTYQQCFISTLSTLTAPVVRTAVAATLRTSGSALIKINQPSIPISRRLQSMRKGCLLPGGPGVDRACYGGT